MAIPLLRTKFYIPPLQSGVVHRPRLIQLVNEGLSRKLTIISAPAGFGKTTLLNEWIPTCQSRVAWLTLEDADNDPIRFWSYFMAALQILHEDMVKDALAFFQAEEQKTKPAQIESFITFLVNDLADYPDSFAFVLDDYHEISNQTIHKGLIYLIDHLPSTMHIFLTCRADPPFPLARLRARGQMVELRAEDLRFTAEETALFLNQVMQLDLTFDQVMALEARTEGWIAGLQLAAVSMRKRQDTNSFITSFTGSHRFILDYLVDEVLSRLQEDEQSFLLQTSILERFTGTLCNCVTGREDGQGMLEQLEQANLFIIPLDNERRWYRYHHLFADLLRSRLQELKPGEINGLHQRACEWFEREGLLPEAIDHAITTGNFEKAAQLIEKTAETQRQRGEIATLADWMNALPEEIRCSHPALCLAYARALVDSSQNKPIEALIADAEAGLEREPFAGDPQSRPMHGQIAALRAYLAMIRHQHEDTIQYARLAQELLAQDEDRWRSFVGLTLAGAYRFTNKWAAASETYLEASELSRAAGDKVDALLALSMRGEVLQAQGHLRDADQQFKEVIQLAQEYAIPFAPVTGYALIGLGRDWCEWNDLEAAERYVLDGIAAGKKAGMQDILLRGCYVLARIRQARGDFDGALDAIDHTEPAVRDIGLPEVKDWVNALRAQVWLASGEKEAAITWGSSFSGNLNDAIYPSVAITLARIRLVEGKYEEGLGLLEHALHAAYDVGRLGNAVPLLVVKAIAQRLQGYIEEALITLSTALIHSEPERYWRVFLDEGEPMRSLLSELHSKGEKWMQRIEAHNHKAVWDYLGQLMRAFTPHTALPDRKSSIQKPAIVIAEPLSERETEVLHLMAAGLSNRDIAEKDIVSINTVKTQVKSIYGKLGVHKRQDALQLAHDLGLI